MLVDDIHGIQCECESGEWSRIQCECECGAEYSVSVSVECGAEYSGSVGVECGASSVTPSLPAHLAGIPGSVTPSPLP